MGTSGMIGRANAPPNLLSPAGPASDRPLRAGAEPVPQRPVEVGDRVDLAHGGVDVVLDASVADGVVVEQDVAGARVAVARLADGADVAQRLAAVEVVGVVDLLGAVELVALLPHLLDEDAGDVRVALEAVAL